MVYEYTINLVENHLTSIATEVLSILCVLRITHSLLLVIKHLYCENDIYISFDFIGSFKLLT